jgi:hypothetical protein
MNSMIRRTRLSIILIALVLILVLILSYCIPQQRGITLECQPGPAYQTGASLPANPYFVLNQLILSGSPQDVQVLVSGLAEKGITLELYEGCQVSGLERLPAAEQPGEFPLESRVEAGGANNPFFDQQKGRVAAPKGGTLAINLYQIGAGSSVEEAMAAVEALQQQQPELAAYADPNYLTGHLAGSPCSNPFGVEGSPFGVEGSPFGVEGSPDGGQAVPAEADAFWKQWAFGEIGLLPPGDSRSKLNGKGVDVVIFDTSPFKMPAATGNTTENISAISPVLNLKVHHPFALPALALSGGITPVDVKDHGLFVAGLIHAAAPQSQIHLYRVLDDSGCGDLYHLVSGMLRFVADQTALTSKPRTVINLSLGIQKPRLLPDGAERGRLLAEIEARGPEIAAAYRMVSTEKAIESLHTATLLAYQSGAVIIAAAGNDSVHGYNQLESELPGAYPFVLSAAASGPQGQPACYSNLGDIVAPGAQAELDPSEDGSDQTVPHCKPLATACTSANADPANCPYGLISLTTALAPGAAGPYGYAYWVGTSFATPLVSGAAARYYQTASQAQVYQRILLDAVPLADASLAPGLMQIP